MTDGPRLRRPPRRAIVGLAFLACPGVLALPACATSTSDRGSDARLSVVAAENVWGSIAAQLGGDRALVTSIITSPDADPHDYEPRAGDARAMAAAAYVITNGSGYDPWASDLLAARDRGGPAVLDVGRFVGVAEGGNPHRWYSPPDVMRVVDRISSDYERLRPADAAYFEARKAAFEATDLRRYTDLVAGIRRSAAGTPVGASESIFAPMAEALGLRLVTPESFLDAISEGAEPTARDKATVDAQIRSHAIEIYVFNSQNATPDVRAQVGAARAAGIPVASVTETITPAGTSFADWQSDQLERLAAALALARSRAA